MNALLYLPRDKNIIQSIFEKNYSDFEKVYDEVYAEDYGIYRLERISESVEKFTVCGDWDQGIARIKCTNPDCKHGRSRTSCSSRHKYILVQKYFRPFSCKQWYLCPSCHQKRLLLLAEHLSEDVMLRLPHRQFVFTLPIVHGWTGVAESRTDGSY